jgi:hypothetical protein
MTVNTLLGEYRLGIATEFQRRSARDARFEALDKSDIAELSATAINHMTCDELVRMIRVAGLPGQLSSNLNNRLPFYDHEALSRLAHLAQRCCRIHGQRSVGKDAE